MLWRKTGILSLAAFVLATTAADMLAGEQWFKGNTHTHTWWSDGDSPPELAVKWYKDHGYDFLTLSDHNILSRGEKWMVPEGKKLAGAERYEREFADSLQKRERAGKTEYRLRTLEELRKAYEEPGEFILIEGEEISDHVAKRPVHINGINLREVVPPQGGSTVQECIQRNIDAVLAQRKATGVPMFPHLNHPNFGWGVTAEDIAPIRGEQFFEVHNGHPGVRNYGDETHISVERIWDVVLARRLGELNLPVMYGMATDDAHNIAKIPGGANPGRGWVMVRAKELTPEALVKAMEAGDFYPTTGVLLKSIRFANNQLTIEINTQPGVEYTTQFIGTPRNYDRKVTTRPAPDGHVIYDYSDQIGKVLATMNGTKVSYKLDGSELYVRAKITSNRKHPNPFAEGDFEVAWTQPVQPQK